MRSLVLLAALVGACAAEPTAATERPAAHPVRIDPPARAESEASVSARTTETLPSLSREDCSAFETAPALGIAVVVASEPDCSSVGHRRSVLEVRRLGRGSGIVNVGTSSTLYSNDERRLEVGDTVLAAIEPDRHPAETVHCVSLPERQGSLRRAVKVDSGAVAEALLDDVLSGRCGRPR
ncbi:MAG TPA: hypothetical protein VM686_22485 [Polyangiaceae bacterium]|nr:hypothetical protein [Polyangiaceae bacterium]